MSKNHRSKNSNYKKKKNNHRAHEPASTFDPKIHHRGKGQSGYGLKKGYKPTPEENSGAQLKHLFK